MEANIFSVVFLSTFFFILGSVPGLFFEFNKKKYNDSLNIYFSNLFTILLVLIFYSVGKSGFKSVLILFSVPLLIYFYSGHFRYRSYNRRSALYMIKMVPFSILVGISIYFFILPKTIEGDVMFYAKVAGALRENGVENQFHYYNSVSPKSLGVMPYHYVELWLSALIGGITKIRSLIILKYIVYPYMMTVAITGIKGILDQIINKELGVYYSGLIYLIFFCLTAFGSLISYKFHCWNILFSPLIRPNFIIYLVALVPIVFYLIESDTHLVLLFLFVAVLFSVTMIVAAVGGGVSLLLFLLFSGKISLRGFLFYNGIFGGYMFMFALFYLVNSGNIAAVESKSLSQILSHTISIWKSVIVCFSDLGFRCLFLLAVIFFLLRKENFFKGYLLPFTLIFILVTIGSFQLLTSLDNSYQIPHVAFTLLGFLVVLVLCYFLYNASFLVRILLICLFITISIVFHKDDFILLNKVDNLEAIVGIREKHEKIPAGISFLRRVSETMDNHPGVYGFFLDSSSISNVVHRYRMEITLQPLMSTGYFTDHNNLISFNNKSIVTNGEGVGKERLLNWYQNFPYYSNENSPFSFFKDQKVRGFLITQKALKYFNRVGDSLNLEYIRDKDSPWIFVCRKS